MIFSTRGGAGFVIPSSRSVQNLSKGSERWDWVAIARNYFLRMMLKMKITNAQAASVRKKNIFAIPKAAPAIVVKPSNPVTIEISKNIIDQ